MIFSVMRLLRFSFLLLLAATLPSAAFAAVNQVGGIVQVDTGVKATLPGILNSFVDILLMWALPVATAAFLFGAFTMVASGGGEGGYANGKKIMVSALIGLAIVLAAYMIVSTAISFITA